MSAELYFELQEMTWSWFKLQRAKREYLRGKNWKVISTALEEIEGSGHWFCIRMQTETGEPEEIRSRLEYADQGKGTKVFAALLREACDESGGFIHHVRVY